MDKKDFKVLFETPEYINTSGSTEEFMKGIKSKIREEFNEAHKEASEISMPELEDHLKILMMVDLVTEWMLKVNAQLDQLDAYNLLCVLLWPYFVYQVIKWKKVIKELSKIIED